MSRIALIGAGNIARVHADVIKRLPQHAITAIVDPNVAQAAQLSAGLAGARVFASVDSALAADAFDRAHVLVPPQFHMAVTRPILLVGKPVLVEKPLAASSAECRELLDAAAGSGTVLGTNQNFVKHPAIVRLLSLLDAGTMGRPGFVSCLYNVALRQKAARQFSHWMFQTPGNILLEQAVHPLSQIVAIAGNIGKLEAVAGSAMDIAPGIPFVETVTVAMDCARMEAQLRFAVGQEFPFWQVTVVCSDGVVVADILANRVFTYRRTRWLDAVDGMLSGIATGSQIAREAVADFSGYAAALLKLRAPADPFFRSMLVSIRGFHDALDAGRAPELDGAFGAALVSTCEVIAKQALPPLPAPTVQGVRPDICDVAVLGGTGFIGTHTVERLVLAGLRVSVMARSPANLPAVFSGPRVAVCRGDIRDAAAVRAAIGRAPVVVNLAHGGGGSSFEAVRSAMVGGAETVADICREQRVRRLIHVGSIASLYLGPQEAAITGLTPPDPRETERGDYAHAKVLCDRMLLERHAAMGLPVVILRPGLVVGEGTSPFHSGVGFYNNEQHCIGWNDGRNALPFVLVGDVADAIRLACTAEGIEGRSYNLVGGVRMPARDYILELGKALGRPLRYHPKVATGLWVEDMGKWVIKRMTGRNVARPALRDFLSRGLKARFDCSDAQRDLGWTAVADTEIFRQRALLVHA